MDADWPLRLESRARVYAALGEPARLAIVDMLVLGDASPGEIGARFGLPTNLVAHHLSVLQDAGVIERSRSAASLAVGFIDFPQDLTARRHDSSLPAKAFSSACFYANTPRIRI
jgi:hypothetical protein